MIRNATGLRALEYLIGETSLDVDALPNRTEVLDAYRMPDMKAVWGWDRCRKSSRDAVSLAIEVAARTLSNGIDAAGIDGLIVCCGERFDYFEQNAFVAHLAEALGLDRFQSQWLGGAACVNLFTALRMASLMVAGGIARNVLVVGVDLVPDDAHRFQRFGVLSDGACSFVVTERAGSDYTIVDAVSLTATDTLLRGEDFQAKCDLVHAALEVFGGADGFDFDRIDAIFAANVFLPIQELELSLLPVDGTLAWQDNTTRYGHCYSADPFINLVDYTRGPNPATTDCCLLTATAHGHFGMIVLERTDD